VANVDADPLSSQRNGTPSFSSETETDSGSYADSNSARSDTSSTFHKLFDPILHMGRHHHTVDEDPSSRLVTKHIFSKMHVEASDHPFFKRVWLARHVLDENSPVLKPRVRRQIRKNGGSWPERLNTHYAIRESLKFNLGQSERCFKRFRVRCLRPKDLRLCRYQRGIPIRQYFVPRQRRHFGRGCKFGGEVRGHSSG
jgi:hypothetical protein